MRTRISVVFRKLNLKLDTTKIYFSVIYESAAKCKFSDHDPAADSQRNKMRTKKQIWSRSCHWGFNAGGFFCRGPLEVRDSKNWQDTFDKEDKYISQWGEIHWTNWTNMYNYQFIPIYLSFQWRNKSGRHFAAVQWRSEIPRTQWIIRQVCISVFVFAFVYWNCVCIFVFLSIGQNKADKIFCCSSAVEVGDSKNSMDHPSNELDPSLRSNCCRNQEDNNESSISHKKTASLTSSRKSDNLRS